VIELLQDLNLVDKELRLLNVFLGNFLHGPPWPIDIFLLRLVNHSISASTEFLCLNIKYLGMEVVMVQDVVLTRGDKIFLFDHNVWLFHLIYLLIRIYNFRFIGFFIPKYERLLNSISDKNLSFDLHLDGMI
jgi:hypothetical protein